ncbi:hypothetical protein B0F90DRAFT_730013 [Multifurca ochricompacta]|uniref:Uncharacterized protein n=1 Tax=Multifurca ochricompacta TaxID=376703 RepID=A0AAD4MBT6_9AGAM|nr:hypothetical protein B0F90DRAFT_730013 [Multifurca ochricompacta]
MVYGLVLCFPLVTLHHHRLWQAGPYGPACPLPCLGPYTTFSPLGFRLGRVIFTCHLFSLCSFYSSYYVPGSSRAIQDKSLQARNKVEFKKKEIKIKNQIVDI